MTPHSAPFECPEYLLALACYVFPDADTPDERRTIQLEAARELRRYGSFGAAAVRFFAPDAAAREGARMER